MAPLILLALLALPFIEIAVFIEVGGLIGAGPTIGLTILSMFVGAALMRHQGLATLARARETIARNEPPVDEVLDGLCILLAGVLLIIPGFVTDAAGLLLFIPQVRHWVRRWIWGALEIRERRVHGTIIETEYSVIQNRDEEEHREPPQPPRLEQDKSQDKKNQP